MLLTVYLITLVVGGTLVLASLVLGGDHAGDGDVDLDAGHADWGDGFDAWLPITSLRFWTFFAAFFGLTGSLLSGLDLTGELPGAIAAVSVGYLAGTVCVRVIRSLHTQVVDSSVTSEDLIGAGGRATLPVSPGKTGKIRLAIKGRTIELLADTEDDAGIAAGQPVLIYAVQDDGRVLVSRGEQNE